MVPVYSENVAETNHGTRGFEAHYAACPGREFVIKVKEIFPSDAAEYGFHVFLDQGKHPEPDTFDHFMWFGHYKRDSDYERVLKVEGSYRSRKESYALSFAMAVDETAAGKAAVGKAAVTPCKRKHKATVDKATGATAVDVDDESVNQANKDKVGWTVLRFFKVKTDEAGAPIYRPSNHNVQQPRRAAAQRLLHGQGDKEVHTLSSKPGRVIQDQQGTRAVVDKEPVFEDTPVYEVRLRYAAYMGLRLELLGKPPKMRFLRGIPLEALLTEPKVRVQCLMEMVRAAQLRLWAMHAKVKSLLRLGEVGEDGLEPDAKTLAAVAKGREALAVGSLPEGADMSTLLGAVRALEEANGSPVPEPEEPINHGNAFVSLKALLHQIELHFDKHASTILCKCPHQGTPLWEQAMRQFVQGPPCAVSDLDEQEALDPEPSTVEEPARDEKLKGLKDFFTDNPAEYEVIVRASPNTQVLVRPRVIDLDDE